MFMKARAYAMLAALCLLLALQGATAQVTTSPGAPAITVSSRFTTFSGAFTAITPAASATDFLVLQGSATKTIYLRSLECSGVSTAAGVSTIALVKRSSADSGGTALTPSATVGGQLVPMDSNDATATATLTAYSANPTTGTLTGLIRSVKLSMGVTGTGVSPVQIWNYGAESAQTPTLRGANQSFALTGLGSSLASGAVLTCDITWIEQ